MNGISTQLAFSVDEARQQIGGIGRVKFYELLASGELESFKIGSRRMVSSEQLQRFISEKTNGGKRLVQDSGEKK